MLYAILCYNSEQIVGSWTQEQDDAVMARLQVVHDDLKDKLGPAIRLNGTKAAATLMKNEEPHYVVDGPYAETKEALLGFYILDCADADEAMDAARQLAVANPGGAYEIRPIMRYFPGLAIAEI
ncbi:YciI family protein [Phenylobacterium sp.]|uniref:YciI family protein n=1 Tax=Phenylobacterium sp. TaxID=1871053 RepID=UPI00286C449A|nr:YciI family protein [Phenylobacterium sp.]